MLETCLQCLHFIPLLLIVAMFFLEAFGGAFAKGFLSKFSVATSLVLASFGLLAGAILHDSGFAHLELFDPCYGYALSLVFIASKLCAKQLLQKNCA